jgi:phosphoserine phosphatase RsbU/P
MSMKESMNKESQTNRLLLVDDNPTNLQVLYKTLEGMGYELLVANSGENAISVASQAVPDMILLDIMMPGIDGFETCRLLKSDPVTQDSAVIFMSALDETDSKVRGLDLGAVDYITKPFQAEEVVARVETHLQIRSLNKALEHSNKQLADSNARMKRNLNAAVEVQQAMMPFNHPEDAYYSYAWEYHPCDELAGDALNLIPFNDRYIGMYVIDVCGHGVPAALLAMSVTHSLWYRSQSKTKDDVSLPSIVASRLNEQFQMERQANRYFTMLYGVLDRHEHRFQYVTAGHPGPILLRQGQTARMIHSTGFPIGIMPESEYENLSIDLEEGDRLFIFSDGLLEEMNNENTQFGPQRLCELADAGRDLTVHEGLQTIVQGLKDWCPSGQFNDDVTIVGIERSHESS